MEELLQSSQGLRKVSKGVARENKGSRTFPASRRPDSEIFTSDRAFSNSAAKHQRMDHWMTREKSFLRRHFRSGERRKEFLRHEILRNSRNASERGKWKNYLI